MQEPKSSKTIFEINKNNEIRKPSDLSASTNKRRRNPHSSQDGNNPNLSVTKGGSVNTPAQKRGSRSMVNNQTLRIFVLSRLDTYKGKDDKYNGIVRILADAGFLQYCYMLIKGKPGNMSKAMTKETLDGLDYI